MCGIFKIPSKANRHYYHLYSTKVRKQRHWLVEIFALIATSVVFACVSAVPSSGIDNWILLGIFSVHLIGVRWTHPYL